MATEKGNNANSAFWITAAGPSASSNRAKTIDEPVPIALIADYAPAVAKQLREEAGDQVRVWGAIPGRFNSPNFERMQTGDLGLLYAGEDRFDAMLSVIGKTIDPRLARKLWGETSDGETWELISFYTAPVPIDLHLEQFRQIMGYGEDWNPRGFQYPAEERRVTLLEKFGSLPTFEASMEPNPGDASVNPEAALFGDEFKGVPPRPPKGRTYRDDLDPDVTGRGYMAHEETVAKVAQHVGPSFRKGKRGINHDGAWLAGGTFHIIEVKSINGKNEVQQIQKGIGQLLHNRKKAEVNGASQVRAHLILERKPSSPLWGDICKETGLGLTWPDRLENDLPRPS